MLHRLREGLLAAVGVSLLAAITAWIVDLPGRIGLALYEEQFLALVLGCSAALLLGRVPPQATPVRQLGGILGALLPAAL